MSPQLIQRLQKFVDGQRLAGCSVGKDTYYSKAFHPQYRCPLTLFKLVQQFDLELDRECGVYV